MQTGRQGASAAKDTSPSRQNGSLKRENDDSSESSPTGQHNKRQRLKVEDNASQEPRAFIQPSDNGERALERHDKFFYDDGGVILQVGRTLFRLHKTLLSTHSSFFRELFADTHHPIKNYEVTPGVTLPLYTLNAEGLQPDHFAQLLEVAVNPFPIVRDGSLGNRAAGAIARAAHILKFEHIHSWAADELHEIWPSNFDSISVDPEHAATPAAAADALQVAITADVPLIRKSAFYELLRVEDFGQNDGDLSLPVIVYHALTRARQFCATFWMELLLKHPPRSTKCQGREGKSRCAARATAYSYPIWFAAVESEDLRDYWIDPVSGFDALSDLELLNEDGSGVCSFCLTSWKGEWKKKGYEFWARLDTPLGIAPPAVPEAADAAQ